MRLLFTWSLAVVHFVNFDIIVFFIGNLSRPFPASRVGCNASKLLERFSIACRETKTKVTRTANQKEGKHAEKSQ